jgi:GAF domain-containing protein
MTDDRLRAVVAAGVLGADDAHRELLGSVAEVASIFLLDEEADELVFTAVSGEGSDELVGRRFPSSAGVAGWVLVTRQPLVIDDVQSDPRFAREQAESTGYVPRGMLAVPLLHDERALGVLEVLDRAPGAFGLREMELLGLFATQAAIALDLLGRAVEARRVLEDEPTPATTVARLAAHLNARDDGGAGLRLLEALEQTLR